MSSVSLVRAAPAEPVPEIPVCRGCREVPLDLTQPDLLRPDRVLGSCPSCGRVYRVELARPPGGGPERWRTVGRPMALGPAA